jgi:hypothetical protein
MDKEELIKIFINGPLQKYLTGDISFGKMIELINEECGTNFKYSDLYPSYLFNASISYPDDLENYIKDRSERDVEFKRKVDYQGRMEHLPTCDWHSDWHKCNCGAFDTPQTDYDKKMKECHQYGLCIQYEEKPEHFISVCRNCPLKKDK